MLDTLAVGAQQIGAPVEDLGEEAPVGFELEVAILLGAVERALTCEELFQRGFRPAGCTREVFAQFVEAALAFRQGMDVLHLLWVQALFALVGDGQTEFLELVGADVSIEMAQATVQAVFLQRVEEAGGAGNEIASQVCVEAQLGELAGQIVAVVVGMADAQAEQIALQQAAVVAVAVGVAAGQRLAEVHDVGAGVIGDQGLGSPAGDVEAA